ncbi:MAG TPA: signal peptidase II [Longilinea sp.]|nr:signal peptidase II [Longilinea sp.]
MKSTKRALIAYVIIAGLVILLDQFSKLFIQISLAPGATWTPWEWLAPYARIVHWYNTGVAFGMFQNGNTVFAVLSGLIAVAIIVYAPKVITGHWLTTLSMGMVLGGAIGNLIDRLILGHVIDFVSVGTFPVFNVADSGITVGVAIFLLDMIIQEQKLKKLAVVTTIEPLPGSEQEDEA